MMLQFDYFSLARELLSDATCFYIRNEMNFIFRSMDLNSPNRLRFVLLISSHVIIPLGSFSIILLFAFMAQL